MAGVMSMPSARFTCGANAQTTSPPPHATSSTVSSGPAPANSMSIRSASSLAMGLAVENGTACRVNWSTIRSRCGWVVMSSHHRPARAELDAGTLQELPSQRLHAVDQLLLVHERRLVVLDDHAAVHDDRVDAATVGAVHEAVDRVEERPPLRSPRVEEHQVGLLAHLERAQVGLEPERARSVERGELDGHLRGDHAGR